MIKDPNAIRYRMIRFTLGSIAFIVSAMAWNAAATTEEDVEYELVRKYMETGNFIEVHNGLGRLHEGVVLSRYDAKRFEKFLINEWERRSSSADAEMQPFEELFVTVDFAGYILLGRRDGYVEYPAAEATAFLRSIARSGYEALPDFAIVYLSILNDDADASLFEESARRPEMGIFRSSVAALGRLCSTRGQTALETLSTKEADPGRRSYIEEIYDKFYGDRDSPYHCRRR